MKSTGVLYQDESINIDMEIQRKGEDQFHFVLKLSNLHDDRSLTVEMSPESRIRREYAFHFERYSDELPPEHSRVHHGQLTMNKPFDGTPSVMLKYKGEDVEKSVKIRLPLAAIGFVQPIVLSKDRFFNLYDDLEHTQIRNVIPLRLAFRKHPGPFDLNECVKVGGNMAILPEIDERDHNYVLACMMKKHGEVFVRIEIGDDGGRQEGLALVSTRSKNRIVCQAVHSAMLELLCECNPINRPTSM